MEWGLRGREEGYSRKTRGLGRDVSRGQTLNDLTGFINNFILREGTVLRGCMLDSNMIRFAFLIVE